MKNQKALVGRAQWEIIQPPSLTYYNEELGGVWSRQSKEKTPCTFYFLGDGGVGEVGCPNLSYNAARFQFSDQRDKTPVHKNGKKTGDGSHE